MKSHLRDSQAFFASELFRQVQLSGLFSDSKTFADAVAKSPISQTLESYQQQKQRPDFELQRFVNENFELPDNEEITSQQVGADVKQHIELLWQVLLKKGNEKATGSLIPLASPYIVPGGRFREIYYWDSYFTAIGLVASGKVDIATSMLNNLVDLQKQLGVIPNGNRSYYHSRSQPPVLALMVKLLLPIQADKQQFLKNYISAIEAEYQFWMRGAEQLSSENYAIDRVVLMPDGSKLNRYWDSECSPRAESYAEDVELASALASEKRHQFYRNIRAACESGWDFSSRWLAQPDDLTSIQTTELVPVDLNSLLYLTEQYLADFYALLGNNEAAIQYQNRAECRQQAINNYLWCDKQKFYFDYHIGLKKRTSIKSLAATVPLFAQIASELQAKSCQQIIEAEFLKCGGLVTTTTASPQQWDAPNGWAPLHWFAAKGFSQYSYTDFSSIIAKRWLSTVESYFAQTGKLMEKYNVCQQASIAQGGEYDVQEGFGWTNGVTLAFYQQLHL